ncbi:hypothetical protein [Thalassotalea litorea]|uniref:hypothetical protein n=1 Tax=Thalassotalea litorea TaxID=2020715 RepID=UPI003736E169
MFYPLHSHPVIPRYYWESKVKEDPHLREDDWRGDDDRRSQDDGRDGDDESS